MRDPHVDSLRYRLQTEHGQFIDPNPIHHELDAFRLTLDNGELMVEMKDHFATEQDARTEVDPFLRAWEVETALRCTGPKIGFVFEDSTLIDRDPPGPGEPQIVRMSAASVLATTMDPTVVVNSETYPSPPKLFRLSPDADTLWHRYRMYLEGRETLLSMAYFCLSLLEWRENNREQASKKYGIQKKVLDRLGCWTSIKGDMETARKLESHSTLTPLSPTEVDWVRAAVKAIIHRAGELGSAGSLPQIRMSDLPQL